MVALDQALVPKRAQLGRALLGLEVHIVDAEPLAVAVGPFEIVVITSAKDMPDHKDNSTYFIEDHPR